jgi:hypothetical protein
MRRQLSILIAAAALLAGGPVWAQNERDLRIEPVHAAPVGACCYWNSRRAEWVCGY